MTATANTTAMAEALRQAIAAAGVPAGLGVKPETTAGQPWVIVSVLSSTFDGDIELYNSDQEALVFVRAVGLSAKQAGLARLRADTAAFALKQFDRGTITFTTRESVTTPVREDATYPDRSVYYVDSTYRYWLAPTQE